MVEGKSGNDETMTVEEELKRIADASEKKNQYIADIGELAWGLVKGLLIGVVIIAVLYLLLIFGGGIYGFFAYDVFGYDRPTYSVGVAIPDTASNYEPEIFEPTINDLMFELKKLAIKADGDFVQEIYKNCVFALKIQVNVQTFYQLAIDNWGSDRICYQSMKDEIHESWDIVREMEN